VLGDLASIVYPASLVSVITPDRASIFTLFDIGRLRHLITAAFDFFLASPISRSERATDLTSTGQYQAPTRAFNPHALCANAAPGCTTPRRREQRHQTRIKAPPDRQPRRAWLLTSCQPAHYGSAFISPGRAAAALGGL
jgi:hypothetical protein